MTNRRQVRKPVKPIEATSLANVVGGASDDAGWIVIKELIPKK